MNKQFTSPMIRELRAELNEAVKAVAEKYGMTIQFGNARYEDLTATFQVALAFSASEDFDPAKALWDQHCKACGLEPDDFGKTFCFLGEKERYQISGYNPKGRTNCILIRRIRDGKEFITSAESVRLGLGKTPVQQVSAPAPQDNGSAEHKAKMDWDLYCWKTGMKPEDFGKTVRLNGTFYKICGVKPSARVNSILIRHTITGKEYVTSPEQIKAALPGA